MKIVKLFSFVLLPLLLTACTATPDKTSAEQSQQSASNPNSSSQLIEANNVPDAVFTLLEQAKRHENNKNLRAAVSSLERAIRIAPRYAETYYRLGEIRYIEKNYPLAKSLAQKALSLGASDWLREQSLQLVERSSL